MKVRMRNNPEVIEDQVYPEYGLEYGWSKRGMRDGMKIFFTTADWEPIPTEQWRDVTEQCEVGLRTHTALGNGLTIFHADYDKKGFGGTKNISFQDGYRLRKVQVDIPEVRDDGSIVGHFPARQWAFKVERKESHD